MKTGKGQSRAGVQVLLHISRLHFKGLGFRAVLAITLGLMLSAPGLLALLLLMGAISVVVS